MRGLLAIAAALVFVSVAVAAPGWSAYHNARFGTTADVPAGWKMEPPPENDDGRIFVSPDGTARIIVSGILALSSPDEEMARKLEAPQGGVITYSRRGGRWAVVSGLKGDRIFYAKSILSCGDQVWNDLWIEYPAADKAKYDALVAHVAASLRSGEGYQAKDCR